MKEELIEIANQGDSVAGRIAGVRLDQTGEQIDGLGAGVVSDNDSHVDSVASWLAPPHGARVDRGSKLQPGTSVTVRAGKCILSLMVGAAAGTTCAEEKSVACRHASVRAGPRQRGMRIGGFMLAQTQKQCFGFAQASSTRVSIGRSASSTSTRPSCEPADFSAESSNRPIAI